MDKKSESLVTAYIGRIIVGANITEESLTLTFEDGSTLALYDVPDCCEHRYMRSDDSTADLLGARLVTIEEREGPDPVVADGGDEHEVAFVNILTDYGQYQLVMHNEHNGCYGGFSLHVATELPKYYN